MSSGCIWWSFLNFMVNKFQLILDGKVWIWLTQGPNSQHLVYRSSRALKSGLFYIQI